MTRRRQASLRLRVAAAFAGLGALLCLLFALGVWFAAQDLSRRLIDQALRAEIDDYKARRSRNPQSLPPDSAGLRGYVRTGTTAGAPATAVPTALLGLAPGLHDLQLDGIPFRVAVDDHGDSRLYLLFDARLQHEREQGFLVALAAGALLMALIAAIGGYGLAGRVIAPVRELARAVANAPAENPPRLTRDEQADDELRELTRSFDRYLDRLAAFVERERDFAADASHELRTPLAVIRGAAEVLAADPALGPVQIRRVARIERAADEMSALIEGLLRIAREPDAAGDEPGDAATLLERCVEPYQALAAQRGNRMTVEIIRSPQLAVPPALFSIVVGNLIRNALSHTENGWVRLRLDLDRLAVTDDGVGIDAREIGRVFERYYRGGDSRGSGIGLSLVKRICDRQGWSIALSSATGGIGTTATLRFSRP